MSSYTNTTIEALTLIEEVIDILNKRLNAYCTKPNAIPHIVNQQKQVLHQLYVAYSYFNAMEYLALWQDIENTMKDMLSKDPQIGGFAIFIRTNSQYNTPCLIDKYWNL